MRFLKSILLTALLALPSFAALSPGTTWEIRTAGNNNNGGCFKTGGTGTDYSQQDAAQYSFTDAVLDTTTTVSSASHTFVAADVDNCLHFTAGTNFTVGFYRILSVAAGVATLDRVAGTMGATGGTYAVGGAIATVQTFYTNAVAQSGDDRNVAYIKTGTYTVTSTISVGNIPGQTLIGYGSTRGDSGRATITTATNSTILFTFTATTAQVSWTNLILTNTAGTRAVGMDTNSAHLFGFYVTNVQFDGFTSAWGTSTAGTTNSIWTDVEVKNSTVLGTYLPARNSADDTDLFVMNGCWIHDNASHGINVSGQSTRKLIITNSVIANNAGSGLFIDAAGNAGSINSISVWISHTTFVDNGGSGFNWSPGACATCLESVYLENNIFWSNGAYGASYVPSSSPVQSIIKYARTNAYGDNTTAARNNIPVGAGDVTLTSTPFTNAAGGDYSLNSVAGGGAALKGVGYPGSSLFGVGAVDIGPLQSVGTSGGGQRTFGVAQ